MDTSALHLHLRLGNHCWERRQKDWKSQRMDGKLAVRLCLLVASEATPVKSWSPIHELNKIDFLFIYLF